MAQRNVAQRSRSIGLTRQSSGGSRHGSPSLTTSGMFPPIRDLHIAGGTFTDVRGDVVNNYILTRPEPVKDIWAIFRSIPNFRRIYLDMLSKATEGTGRWLLKGDKFRVWLEPNGDIKIFWGSGMPGAGKTLLVSIVIQHLETLQRELGLKVCVCYVYFRYSELSEVTVRTVLEVLVKQTLERHPGFQPLVEETYIQHLREDTEPTEAQLLALLRQLNKGVAVTFYVLDALDEAPKKIQLAIIRTLASLNIKLFITSRPLKTIEETFPEAHTFSIVAHDADLDLHISKGIENSAELQRLLRADPALRDEIFLRIKQNCGGMFLHASLQLDALCECFDARSVRATLDTFPSSIEDVYNRTWARISNERRDHATLAKGILVSVLNASRSMTLDELERAVATSPVTHKYEPDRRVPVTTLLSACGGLVTLDEESRLVRLVHYTAKEILEGLLQKEFPHPHSLVANVCMTHLAECGLQKTTISSEEEFWAVLEKDPLLVYASEAWAFHAHAMLHVQERQIAQFIGDIHAFPAFTNHDHSWTFDILTPIHILALYDLPLALLRDTTNPNIITAVRQESALMVASRFGHEQSITSLLALPEIQVNLVDNDGCSALILAATNGREGAVKLLLAHPDVQVNLVDNIGQSALIRAALGGREGTVKLLLAHPDIQVNLVDNNGQSVLIKVAALVGDEGILKLLLEHPDIQINSVDSFGCSALIRAAWIGREDTVKLLLAHPDVQVNLVDNDGCSALIRATSVGYEGTVKLILAHPDIQVNLVNHNGWSALILAACEGSVKLLLAHPDIQVNLVDNYGWSALIQAASYGQEGLVKLLLAHPDIEVNLLDNQGHSALICAAQRGQEGTVKLLLAHPDIEVNLVNNYGASALIKAAWEGHEGTTKLILAHPDVHVDLATNHRSTALLLAAEFGHHAIVECVLATGNADVNTFDNDTDSALKMASARGHEEIVRLLLALPNVDTTIRGTKDGHTAESAAQADGHVGIVALLQDFEAERAAQVAASPLHHLSAQNSVDEDGSDSDGSESYFDAEEVLAPSSL